MNGLHLAEMSEGTRAALSAVLPSAASLQNPVDMLASATPEQYAACLRCLLTDPGVHAVMVILPPPPMHTAGAIAKAMIPVIYNSDKPVVIALMGERLIQEAVEHFRAAHVPEYRFPERAASALAILAQRAEYLGRVDDQPVISGVVDSEKVRLLLEEHTKNLTRPSKESGLEYYLPPEILGRILEAYGIPTLPIGLARTAEEAVEQANKLGYPVAIKVASPTILHKSEIGGVLLNLEDPDSVAQGFLTIVQNTRTSHPEAEISGVHIQRMLTTGQEVIVGAIQDPQFGPLVMFGSGGVEVEGLKDVAFALAPMTGEESEYLLESTWAGQKLRGYRNLPPADRDAVRDILLRLAQLAGDFPELAEVEINPLRVLPVGQGAYAVDMRARLHTTGD
jgi:acetyltransferase